MRPCVVIYRRRLLHTAALVSNIVFSWNVLSAGVLYLYILIKVVGCLHTTKKFVRTCIPLRKLFLLCALPSTFHPFIHSHRCILTCGPGPICTTLLSLPLLTELAKEEAKLACVVAGRAPRRAAEEPWRGEDGGQRQVAELKV